MKPIRVGLLGIGTVGRGTWDVLQRNASEIRRRAGRPIRIHLRTVDVIHSFWVPKLAGKVDMTFPTDVTAPLLKDIKAAQTAQTPSTPTT